MEKETVKLINVLRRIARSARYAGRSKFRKALGSVSQYNKVLARLSELEPKNPVHAFARECLAGNNPDCSARAVAY
jgi:hypothetical protein